MSQFGIVGDQNPTELPEKQVDNESLDQAMKLTKFKKSKDFALIENHFKDRIDFYQTYLPDGSPIASGKSRDELVIQWQVANLLISEFKAVINIFEAAEEVVKDATQSESPRAI